MKFVCEFFFGGKIVIMVMYEINFVICFVERFVFILEGWVVVDGGCEILKFLLFREVYGMEVEIGEVYGILVVVFF